MSGDNLAIFLFIEGLAVTFFLEGRKEEGWRKYAFWIATLIFAIVGISWPKINMYWPTGTLEGRAIAANPESWLLLFLVVMIFISFSGIQKKVNDLAGKIDRLPDGHSTISASAPQAQTKPDLRLSIQGSNIFIPDAPDVRDTLTAIHLNASVWNVGSPSVAISWMLTVCPPGKTPVIAQHTQIPTQLNAGGPIISATVRASDSLSEKTKATLIGTMPESGSLLFYVKLSKELIVQPETRLELSVSDIFGKETVFVQRVGDWLSR